MRKTRGLAALLLSSSLVFTLLLSGCGKNEPEITTEQSNTSISSVASNHSTEATVDTTIQTMKGNKKIVIVQETADDTRVAGTNNAIAALEKGGYVKDKNAQITILTMESNDKSGAPIVEKIREINPDVVIINPILYAQATVGQPLGALGIPCITSVYAESFVDTNGIPRGNVTGIYSMPKNLQEKAFNLLNMIAPIKGKKAVFITQDGLFTEQSVRESLKKLNIDLKAYVTYKYTEEFKTIIDKYNNDDEVGWTLLGLWPMLKKDGTTDSIDASPKADYWKKPTITYWENGVSWGLLCGLGVDLPTSCAQAGEMAVEILDGKSIKDIKAQEPRKTNILLNQKRAEAMGINFPAEILGSAPKVFTDYEAHFKNNK